MDLLYLWQDYVKKIEENFGKGGAKILNMSATQYRAAFNKVFDAMRISLGNISPTGLLKEYSPWLDSFQKDNYLQTLEVPGNMYKATVVHTY